MLQIDHADALAKSAVTVAAGASLAVGSQVQAVVPGLANNGQVDVGLGKLTVATGLTASDLVDQIIGGVGTGGTAGITSSAAALSGGAFTVGWLDNGDGSMTFGYAAPGDANLDWSVDILDVGHFIGGGRINAGLPASWSEGDFNHDGFADILDISAFMSSGLFNADPYNATVPSIAAVPEPRCSALTLAGLACLAVACRRFVPVRARFVPGVPDSSQPVPDSSHLGGGPIDSHRDAP